MAPSSVTLTYFGVRGRAEQIRWILAQAGVAYKDRRISQEEWGALKPNSPSGGLPVLNVDGTDIGQSSAIAMYLGSTYGLTGANGVEAGLIHMIFDSVQDAFNNWNKAFSCTDKEKQAELYKELAEVHIANLLKKLKPRLEGGRQWLVGSKVSVADLTVACFLSERQEPACVKVIKSFPEAEGLMKRVLELPNIKKWRANRPVTQF